MNHDFDTFVKEHLQDILCEAEKEHALASLKKVHKSRSMRLQLKIPHPLNLPDVQLQDCAAAAVGAGQSMKRLNVPTFKRSNVNKLAPTCNE